MYGYGYPVVSLGVAGTGLNPPVNTVAPAITGTAEVGQTLSCSTGTWSNDPISYAYQWKRGGVNIVGATSSTYVLVAADAGTSVKCTVTATNGAGSATADSNAVNPDFYYILSDYSASAAYSLRKISSTATNAIRIRRSNDNAETDIGFSGVDLDTAAVTSFVGANSAYITTWYDQSGNGKHQRQTSAGLQPIIVNAGTIVTMLSKPAIQLTSSRYLLGSGTVAEQLSFSSNQRIDSFQIFQQSAASFVLNAHRIDSSFFNVVAQSGSGSSPYTGVTSVGNHYKNGASATITTRGQAYTVLATNTPLLYTQINYVNTTQSITSYTQSGYAGFEMQGYSSEWLVFNSDQSGNRTAIETNINSYYGIY